MVKGVTKFLLAAFISAFLGLGYYLYSSPVYVVSSILEVGRIGATLIQDPQLVIGRLRSDALLNDVCKEVGSECTSDALRSKFSLYQIGEGVHISCRHASDQIAARICSRAISIVIREHENRINDWISRNSRPASGSGLNSAIIHRSMLLNAFDDSIKRDRTGLAVALFLIFSVTFMLVFAREIWKFFEAEASELSRTSN
jgi:hypothetical protein